MGVKKYKISWTKSKEKCRKNVLISKGTTAVPAVLSRTLALFSACLCRSWWCFRLILYLIYEGGWCCCSWTVPLLAISAFQLGWSQVFRKVGCTSLDIEAIRKTQIEPRDFPEKSTKTQSEGSKENRATLSVFEYLHLL